MAQVAIIKRNYLNSIKSYSFFTLILVILAGYYLFTQYSHLAAEQQALSEGQQLYTTLKTTEGTVSKQYTDLKNNFDQNVTVSVLDALQSVYPTGEHYTDLVRSLDSFFQANNTDASPMFASDVRFNNSQIDPKKDYAILPVTLTLSTSQENFIKFLNYVQNSGVLALKTRLMDVKAISINFANQAGTNPSASPLLNVSINLNAFFQKPASAKTANNTSPSSNGSAF